MKEEIYKTKIKFKGKFNLKDFYTFLHDLLSEKYGWEAIPGKDYYETYYYHKITADGLNFIEVKWNAKKNFLKEEPKIDWYLELTILVNAYKDEKGDLEINIKAEHEIEDIKEPEVKSFWENILINYFRFNKEWLKKVLKKSINYEGLKKNSAKRLYIESEEIKKEIINYLKALSY